MDNDRKASLGCGTLIVIALIVMMFGNNGGRDAADQVRNLREDVKKLDQTVAAQTSKIDSLEQRITSLLGPATKPAQVGR
jgi:cell division protein FtsL